MIKVPNPLYQRAQEVKEFIKQGITYKEIAKKYGISPQMVSNIALKDHPKFFIRAARQQEGREYVRSMVRERDKFTCQKKGCGRIWQEGERQFDVHHLNGLCGKKSRGYDRVDDMAGLITYCHMHHMREHSVRKSESSAQLQRKDLKTQKLKDFRVEIATLARERGFTFDEVGAIFGVKSSAVYQWLKK